MVYTEYPQYGSISTKNQKYREIEMDQVCQRKPFWVLLLAAATIGLLMVLAAAKRYPADPAPRRSKRGEGGTSLPLLASSHTTNTNRHHHQHLTHGSSLGHQQDQTVGISHDNQGVIVSGFEGNIYSKDNPSGKLRWYCAPDSWKDFHPNSREGRDGHWSLGDKNSLVLTPPAKKDFWRKTYYDPILIKDDGPILYAELNSSKHYTIETSFVLQAVRQFDQAGLVVRLGPEHWLKTGIEVVDRKPRLSCVVTNVYSDWSTQAWSNYTIKQSNNVNTVQVACQIRVHCRGTSFVVEAKMPDSDWELIRIAHISPCMKCQNDPLASVSSWQGPAPPSEKMWAGVFAASPEDQQGGHASFTSFDIRAGSHFEHNADGNQDA